MGSGNHVFEGAVIGGLPQCTGMTHSRGKTIIGNGNMIRENCTIHRSKEDDGETVLGDNNMLMVNVHVAHDCRIGDNVLVSNNTMFAGHVVVESRAVVSGAVGVHQFCRIGTLAMVGGQARVVKDIPPYMRVDGKTTGIVGLNIVGLTRHGYSHDDIKILKSIYRIIYRSGLPWLEIVATLKRAYTSGPGFDIARFLESADRGITRDRRSFRCDDSLSDPAQ
jgi:UDP-N-acetylglucosamine acyltransferase